MIQRSPRLFIAEIQVPIFERLGLEVSDAEADSAGGISSSCNVLNVGDIILAEAYPDEAAEECGEEWLRILEHRFRLCPSVLEDLDEELGVDEGSTDASESDDGDPSDQHSQFKVYRGAPKSGGLVLRRHRVMGTFLRPINKELAESKEEPTQEPNAPKRELPEEAQIWPRDILERFLVTGERPRWTSDPGEGSLALAGPMSRIEVEEALRTAALWLSRADALLVLADGMEEKGPAWPRMKQTGKTFEQMCTRASFMKEPQLAWECWLRHCQNYRESTPHACYSSPVFQHTALGAFVLSSSWDGHWAMAGWASHLLELNGSALELRCECGASWASEELWESCNYLPTCPRCSAPALPAVKLFDEEGPLDTDLYKEQDLRFQSFLKSCSQIGAELLIIELAASPCSELRRRAEDLLGHPPTNCRTRLLRIQRRFPALPRRFSGRAMAVPLPCPEALKRMEALLPIIDMGSFLFQDSAGGVEVVAPRDAPLSFAFRKACGGTLPSENATVFKAGSVLREFRVQDLSPSDVVPPELFFKDRDDFPPVVRIWLTGTIFPARNERLEKRLSNIWNLIKDLVEAFDTEEYQRNFEAAPDRTSALKVIQEVQLRVLPCHGFAISGDESQIAMRITQMQGFLQSGRIDPRVSPALEHSVHLSGYARLLSKAMTPKAKSSASSQRSLVLAQPTASADDYWKHSHRPPKALWIASTWNKFSPQEMKWDGSKFYHNFQVGSNGWESFQLLVDGRWEQCVYPSIPDGCPFVKYELRGPNNKGHGKNWTVGRHSQDQIKVGDKVRVTVSVNSQGLPKEVGWREVRRAR